MPDNYNKSTVKGTTSGSGTKSGAQGQSAKDKSRAQSRPVAGKAPSAKGGGGSGGGGNRPRPGGRPAAQPAPSRMSGAKLAWGIVVLVVVVIVIVVVVGLGKTNSSNPTNYTAVTTAPASVVHDVTNIPASVYNKIGVTSPTVAVQQPIVLTGQPALVVDGKTPAMIYYGAEWCPYCAAERWAMTAALSRFGTWSGLKVTASSHTDVAPETHTFSYHGATFTSKYLTFKSIEAFSTKPLGVGVYQTLETPTAAEQKIITAGQKFIPGASADRISFPFINIGNKAIISGASYDPGTLAGLSWTDIAGALDDPTNPNTQAIVATANYITAAICASTKNAPSSVCTSPGVVAAATALKLG